MWWCGGCVILLLVECSYRGLLFAVLSWALGWLFGLFSWCCVPVCCLCIADLCASVECGFARVPCCCGLC